MRTKVSPKTLSLKVRHVDETVLLFLEGNLYLEIPGRESHSCKPFNNPVIIRQAILSSPFYIKRSEM